MKIIGDYQLFLNPAFKSLTDLIVLYNADRKGNGSNIEVTIRDDHESITINAILGWVSAGGIIEGFPCFFEMTPTAYAKAVPAGIPNRTYFDENDIELFYKWNEWHDATHEHKEIDGKHYVPSNSFDKPLTGAELAIVNALSGVNILTNAQYVAKIPVSESV
jgi:hypothetical protein